MEVTDVLGNMIKDGSVLCPRRLVYVRVRVSNVCSLAPPHIILGDVMIGDTILLTGQSNTHSVVKLTSVVPQLRAWVGLWIVISLCGVDDNPVFVLSSLFASGGVEYGL